LFQPDDLGAPVPGNAGVLLVTNVQPSSVDLAWGKANDDKSKQQDLEYQAVYSQSDNIASLEGASANGTVAMNWTRDVGQAHITGLTAGTDYYFNVLVRDGSDNEAAYVMTLEKAEQAPVDTTADVAPVPGNGGTLVLSDVQDSSLTLSWAPASDNTTDQTDLEYRVVMSQSDNIATVEDAATNGTQVLNWTADTTAVEVSGLSADAAYYFNVLVRDAAGNVASYVMTQATTASAPVDEAPKIIWADQGRDMVLSANLDGTGIDTLLSDYRLNLDTPNYLTIDRARKKLYVSDWGTDRIIRMGIDGSNPEVIISNPDVDGPVGMGFDNTGDRLFFLDQYTDRIQRSAPDGSLIEQLITGVLNIGYGMAVDGEAHEMYWTDWGDTLVYRASMAGTNRTAILTSADGIVRPLGLAIDPNAHQIYFTGAVNQKIYRANTDGTGLQPIISTGLQFPIACALDLTAGKVYWADANTKLIERANLDGTSRETVLDFSSMAASPYAVTIWRP